MMVSFVYIFFPLFFVSLSIFGGEGVTAHQDHFFHFEPSQSLGGAKTGNHREKTPDHPQTELGLSHVTQARLEPTVVR